MSKSTNCTLLYDNNSMQLTYQLRFTLLTQLSTVFGYQMMLIICQWHTASASCEWDNDSVIHRCADVLVR